MKTLRIIGAAFLVFLGAMLMVAWSVAGKTVAAIESGEAANNLTQKLLDDPNFSAVASESIVDGLDRRTEGRFINRIVVAFRPELEQIVQSVLESDRLNEAVTNSVDKVSTQLTEELTEADRPSAPFVLSIDLSDRVNQRIDEIPVVGTFIPDVTVPPVEKELIDAKTFDQIRGIYSGLKLVSTWGLIIGIALIVGGFFVAPRSRWYWPQALLGAAFIVLAVSIAVRRIVPTQVANALPGDPTSGGPTFIKDFLSDNATGPIASRLAAIALWSFVLAVLFWLIARMLPGFRDTYLAKPASEATVETTEVVEVAEFVAPVGVPDAPVASHAQVVDTVVLEPVVEQAPAKKAPVKKAPVKKAPAKTTPAKPTAAEPTAAKTTPAKTTKAAAASGSKPAPKTTRARKPTPPKE